MEKMHILIAPNAFKNSLDAERVALAIRQGLERSELPCVCACHPIGDGGDGTGELIIKKCGGVAVPADVQDPLGRKIAASFGLIEDGAAGGGKADDEETGEGRSGGGPGQAAVIEMANASGLRL